METFIVILVLVALLVLLGGAMLFYGREAGPDAGRLWLTGTRQLRQIVTPSPRPAVTRDLASEQTDDDPQPAARQPYTPELEARQMAIALTDTRIRELAEELRGELTRAAGVTREFDARLHRVEEELSLAKELPGTIDQRVADVELSARKRINRLKQNFHTARQAESPYGVRRCEAISEMYTRLANIDTALAAVVNPMLLPGEPLEVPEALYDDTLEWENWEDVGERAFAFGEAFNQNRFLLDVELAASVERFIATFRSALTSTVYPVVQNPNRTTTQRHQMRASLVTIVEGIPPLRRQLESAYREASIMRPPVDDDDDDDLPVA